MSECTNATYHPELQELPCLQCQGPWEPIVHLQQHCAGRSSKESLLCGPEDKVCSIIGACWLAFVAVSQSVHYGKPASTAHQLPVPSWRCGKMPQVLQAALPAQGRQHKTPDAAHPAGAHTWNGSVFSQYPR